MVYWTNFCFEWDLNKLIRVICCWVTNFWKLYFLTGNVASQKYFCILLDFRFLAKLSLFLEIVRWMFFKNPIIPEYLGFTAFAAGEEYLISTIKQDVKLRFHFLRKILTRYTEWKFCLGKVDENSPSSIRPTQNKI